MEGRGEKLGSALWLVLGPDDGYAEMLVPVYGVNVGSDEILGALLALLLG
jgi:hypothetical protein